MTQFFNYRYQIWNQHKKKINIAKQKCGATEQAKNKWAHHKSVFSQLCLFTILALICFFPCVCHGMYIQIMFTLESIITMTTLIWLLPQYVSYYGWSGNVLQRNSYHNDYIYRVFHLCVSLNALQDHNLLRTPDYNN